MDTSKKTIITALICLVLGFFLGTMFPQAGGGVSNAQLEKVKQMFPVIPDMTFISGTVKSVNGSTLSVTMGASPNPFDEWPTSRTVTVNGATQIIRTRTKSGAEYQRDLDAYTKAGGKGLKYPSYTSEETIKLSDLKVGDSVVVQADHDIKTASSFTATKVAKSVDGTDVSNYSVPPPPLPVAQPATTKPSASTVPSSDSVAPPPLPASGR